MKTTLFNRFCSQLPLVLARFAAAYTRQYVQPVLFNRAGLVDLPKETTSVAGDVTLARDWKPGSIDEQKIKRSGTESGFRE